MPALTQQSLGSQDVRGKSMNEWAIKDAEAIFLGGYIALESATGRAVAYTDAAGLVELGRAVEFNSPLQSDGTATGDSAGTVKVAVDIAGGILFGVPVAGAAAETDVGDQVYSATDNIDADLTTTPTVNGKAIGEIVRFRTATSFDVLLYSQETIRAL